MDQVHEFTHAIASGERGLDRIDAIVSFRQVNPEPKLRNLAPVIQLERRVYTQLLARHGGQASMNRATRREPCGGWREPQMGDQSVQAKSTYGGQGVERR
jgi:hypothetical protein